MNAFDKEFNPTISTRKFYGGSMNRMPRHIGFLLAFLLTANGIFYNAFADHDDHKGKSRYQKKEREHAEHYSNRLWIVNNPTYIKNCGACHFVYQPQLLPSGSWDAILDRMGDHFGETAELDTESKKIISEYLRSNAAEFSSSELSGKIMRSIGDQTPLRITQIPYIQKKHREIDPDIFAQESVGSLSNCSACHTTAQKGIYDDDHVTMPR